jgi:uracil-DNA glycosylase family 4
VGIKHPLAKCEECPLLDASTFVPSEWPVGRARVVFVGEAPGVQEAREGRPFIGPSGKLLDIVTNHYGIERSECGYTNACLCRPKDGSTPPTAAINACRPRLLAELSDRGTEDSIVVTLGNSAALAVLQHHAAVGVTKLRVGPGRQSEALPGRRIISTIHPAACLRQADLFPSLVQDIGKVVTRYGAWSEPDWKATDNPVEALSWIEQLKVREGPLAVDIEVDIEKDTAFDHPNNYGLLCIGIGYASNKAVVFGEGAVADRVVLDNLAGLLRGRRIIAQNGKFDLSGLYNHLGPLELWFDTMLAHYCLDERVGTHGLKSLAVEFLGAPAYDQEVRRFVGPRDGYGVVPRPVLYKYNAYDATCTFALYELFSERMDKAGLRPLHDFLVEASNELMYLELNGITVDVEHLDRLASSYLNSLGTIETDLAKIAGAHLNPRSPLQVKQWLLDHKIGTDSTNEESISKIIEWCKKQDPFDEDIVQIWDFCETLLKHRKEAKLYGTYVKGIRKRLYRGRVYPTFLLHGSVTGRLSCRNPNLQNIPRDSTIRKLFVPSKPDNVLLQADYAQAELRVVAWLARDDYLAHVFNSGRDLFDELAQVLYPNIGELSDAEAKELRIRIKAYVYGLAYGREEFSIAQEFKISVGEALRGMQAFFDVIPGVVEWRKNTRLDVLANRDLITPFGRHRRFHLITNDNRKDVLNEALAFLPQSTSSDICLRAATRLRRDLRGTGYIRNLVHDSILVECAESDSQAVSGLVQARMVESAYELVGDYVAFKADTKVGKHWGEV